MERPATSCDFCGDSQELQEHPIDHAALKWYTCTTCTRIIEDEEWDHLVERSFVARDQLHSVPQGEESILRKQVENLVEAFRSFRLVTV